MTTADVAQLARPREDERQKKSKLRSPCRRPGCLCPSSKGADALSGSNRETLGLSRPGSGCPTPSCGSAHWLVFVFFLNPLPKLSHFATSCNCVFCRVETHSDLIITHPPPPLRKSFGSPRDLFLIPDGHLNLFGVEEAK